VPRKRRSLTEIVNARYGRLTVISRMPGQNPSKWLCRCDCGNEAIVAIANLRPGKTRSCGCFRSESTATRNALVNPWKQLNEPEYSAWCSMRARCNETHGDIRYLSRGIGVCERWGSFKNFIDDMGKKPSAKHSIDRIDNDKGYSPDNCRWATNLEQSRNRRSNVPIAAFGETLLLSDWSARHGIAMSVITGRLRRGWGADDAVSTPTHPRTRKFGKLPKAT
jgi:hypothetical protein